MSEHHHHDHDHPEPPADLVLPDRNAEGSGEGQHLYSVRFEASELWGEDAVSTSAVYIDMWEAYLEPT